MIKNRILKWLINIAVNMEKNESYGYPIMFDTKKSDYKYSSKDSDATIVLMISGIYYKEDNVKFIKTTVLVNNFYIYYERNFNPPKSKWKRFLFEIFNYRKIKKEITNLIRKSYLHEKRHTVQYQYMLDNNLDVERYSREENNLEYGEGILEKDAINYENGIEDSIEEVFKNNYYKMII